LCVKGGVGTKKKKNKQVGGKQGVSYSDRPHHGGKNKRKMESEGEMGGTTLNPKKKKGAVCPPRKGKWGH